jgi:predicted RecA/RadA family phage recombinase
VTGADDGVARVFNAASGAEIAPLKKDVATEGVFDLPKLASAVIAAGDAVAWDDTAKRVNAPATGRYPIGIAIEAAGNRVAIVRVRLDGIATRAA